MGTRDGLYQSEFDSNVDLCELYECDECPTREYCMERKGSDYGTGGKLPPGRKFKLLRWLRDYEFLE